MERKKINVEISWEDKNFCCGWSMKDFGAIICTAKTLEELKSSFEDALREQVASMLNDGEALPDWLANNEYDIDYSLTVSALLRQAEQYTTMAVISRVTGINQKQLSHYASSIKIPRSAQRDRIVKGLHSIGEYFISVH